MRKKITFILEEDDIYSPQGGNSLTLTLHDILNFGLRQFEPFVIGGTTAPPYAGGEFVPIDGPTRKTYLLNLRQAVARLDPSIVISLQSFRLAMLAKSWFPRTSVALYRHNLVRRKRRISALFFAHRITAIDRFIFCSDFIREHFEAQYPQTASRCDTVWNGFDLQAWRPAAQTLRTREIVLAGRCHPEKGVEEAALAIATVLSKQPEWRALMFLSFPERFPALFKNLSAIAAPFAGRFVLHQNAPFDEVKSAYERAAMCLVPSIWDEPFGRVAAEGHLGGCCVISSGRGGLREVSADTAYYLDDTTPQAISTALTTVVEDPGLRTDLAKRGNERANRLFSLEHAAYRFERALLSIVRS